MLVCVTTQWTHKTKAGNSYKVAILFLLLSFLLLSSCSTLPSRVILQQHYRNAIEDARIAEAREISRDLVSIIESNDSLIWDDKRILVVTWTSWNGYNNKVGQSVTTTKNIWVTVVPQVKDFCNQHNLLGERLILRLEQLLGLPPGDGKKWFVEIWVKPDNLFRPSPDPEIADCEAELNFPQNTEAEYIEWFNNLKSISYSCGEEGYPWTRLGYTYDWGNPKGEIGLSEFVVRKGAIIEINSVSSTSEYCR